MTIIEQRAAESMAYQLPRIVTELIRANNLKALAIRLAIETLENKADYEATLESIMSGMD